MERKWRYPPDGKNKQRDRKKLWRPAIRDANGSITLEAAIALPFFLTFMLALVTIVQMAVTEIALQSAVSETAKQIAHHYEPIHWLQQKGEAGKSHAYNALDLPAFVRPWIDDLLEQASGEVLAPMLSPVLRLAANEQILDKERISVVYVRLPHPSDRSQAYVEMEAEYRMQLLLPFFQKELILRKKAWERAWYGEVFE